MHIDLISGKVSIVIFIHFRCSSYYFLLFLIAQTNSCPLTDEYLSRCHCGILTNGDSYIKCEENSLNEVPKFKRSFPYDELIIN